VPNRKVTLLACTFYDGLVAVQGTIIIIMKIQCVVNFCNLHVCIYIFLYIYIVMFIFCSYRNRPQKCNGWVHSIEACPLEADVVILSLGSFNPDHTKAAELSYFLHAISRAKRSLYIVGHLKGYKVCTSPNNYSNQTQSHGQQINRMDYNFKKKNVIKKGWSCDTQTVTMEMPQITVPIFGPLPKCKCHYMPIKYQV
jgi:hypothetical protein